MEKLVVKKTKKRNVRPRRAPRYTNQYRFEFGETRLPQHPRPTPEDVSDVTTILGQERKLMDNMDTEGGDLIATTPFHAGGGISIDSIVRVIISQSCTNEAALDAQQTMIRAYPYTDINGILCFGKKPNYHLMRLQSFEKLQKVLKKAGLYIIKAKGIKQCLEMVFEKNLSLLGPGELAYEGNEPGVTDFVPGLLSLDYLYDIYDKGGKQAVFDSLVQLPQIGVKSACCLMGFNMSLPVFAVDTHVASMAKLLG